jgi:hypothetical protein
MSEVVDDRMKQKRIIAYSRDIIVILLDDGISSKFLSKDFAAIFRENSETLIHRVETNMSQVIADIDSGNYAQKLAQEGLSELELDFKYSLFNEILIRAGLPVTLSDYNNEEIYPTIESSKKQRIKNFVKKKIESRCRLASWWYKLGFR